MKTNRRNRLLPRAAAGFLLATLAAAAAAQQGDKKGEKQVPLSPGLRLPPSSPLPPREALKALRAAPGFRVELVAAEPLVVAPVVAAFDPDGRLWVVEMRGYMPDVGGRGEDAPVGRIAVLTDVDGDGRMDRRREFLDGLVLPRALAFFRDGVLVGEPPNLWFCRDTDGDGRADVKERVTGRYGAPGNPEHTANGLLRGLDNWYHNADHDRSYRYLGGRWVEVPTPPRGQWGIAQDDRGLFYFNANSDPLRADTVPYHPDVGANAVIDVDRSVWPIRPTPGVNRGYRAGFLRQDGTLTAFTACGGILIYRGDLLPSECRGNAFVCEPSANLVRRFVMEKTPEGIAARNAYDRAEFLASTDERFRPVNLAPGPDGALYVVDLARGIIEHRVFVTTFLRQQILERGLERPTGLGRIWRVIPEKSKTAPSRWKPALSHQTPAEWVTHLSDPDGWWRDTAQRLLVERGDASVVPALRALVVTGPHPGPLGVWAGISTGARLHALWTLEGLGALDPATLAAGVADADPAVRAAAIRLAAECTAREDASTLRDRLLAAAPAAEGDVRRQLAYALARMKDPRAEAALAGLIEAAGKDPLVRALVEKGKRGGDAPTPVPAGPALVDEDPATLGRRRFESLCAVCHDVTGSGREGLGPPLAGSDWVVGPHSRIVRIVLNGLDGPIAVKGATVDRDMPSLKVLPDEEIAAILTYIRSAWGHAAGPVTPADVAGIRAATADRQAPWTEGELKEVP